jgi:hypothetical protein
MTPGNRADGGVFHAGLSGGGRGWAQARTASGLAFHCRKRASAGPARDVPVAAAFIKVSAQVWAKPIRSGRKFGEDSHSQPVDREWAELIDRGSLPYSPA